MSEQNENISKEMEIIKRNQKKKSGVEMKNSLEGFDSRFKQAEERITELED